MDTHEAQVVAFAGTTQIASGPLSSVALVAKRLVDGGTQENVLVFDVATSQMVEVDLRGSEALVLSRVGKTTSAPTAPPQRGPGRPRLGVVAREVTLLPRHWEWLATQPGGASVALRKLVEEARRTHVHKDQVRQSREVAYRFMSALAGDLPGFEEASRALFGNDAHKFASLIRDWPRDVVKHLQGLAADAFSQPV